MVLGGRNRYVFLVLTMTGSNGLETDAWLPEVGAEWRHPGMFSMCCVDK